MLLAQAGLDMSTPEAKEQSIAGLMSNDKFAELLKGMGVDPPTKISITTGEETWAFAKTDEQFKELLEHPDQDVQTLVAARFGHKTTLEESRTERLINVANLNFPGRGTGFLPVPLKVPGAHTLRLSGDWKWNLQNLARPSRRRPRAMLRESIVTPEGYSLVVGDESQVEARGNALFCGQMDLVEEFRRNEDPYCNFGSKVFGRTITKADVGERFMSKTAVLSCGYGVGWLKYQASIRHLSKEQTGTAIILADHEAMRHITMYRTDKYQIAAMWKYLNNVVIPAMTRPDTDFMLGPVRVMFEKIVLPTGLCLHYRQLHKHPQTGDWWFIYGQRIKKLYGGKLLENIIQALCRVIVMQAALRLRKSMAEIGSRAVLQAHDELGYLVPDEHVAQAKALLEVELRRPPVWWPAIPLNCEVGVGKSYGKAK
jgi:DNA polymerase I-like protein with 3'-5' exonuclease and polymerase domains